MKVLHVVVAVIEDFVEVEEEDLEEDGEDVEEEEAEAEVEAEAVVHFETNPNVHHLKIVMNH